MSRSDLVVSIVKAGTEGDQELFRRSVASLSDDERARQHHGVADKLDALLQRDDYGARKEAMSTSLVPSGFPDHLLHREEPKVRLSHLLLPDEAHEAVPELIEEQHRAQLLRASGIEPRNRVLLIGEPGNGKTSLAHAIADALLYPLYSVRYDGLIGSYLGETAQRLHKIFSFVSRQPCVLFLDEFDAIGKERGDRHDAGEMKRVVGSLLLEIDKLPSHVVVIAATNHEELLDRAVWRRFQIQLVLPPPSQAARAEWFGLLERRLGYGLGLSAKALARKIGSTSFAEMEELGTMIVRRLILRREQTPVGAVTAKCLQQWLKRHRIKTSRAVRH